MKLLALLDRGVERRGLAGRLVDLETGVAQGTGELLLAARRFNRNAT